MLSLLVQSTLFLLFSRNFPNIHCDRIEARPRIVNGVTASNIIPYQASLRVSIRDRASFGRGHTCGAVLISDRVLLTAAHCLYDGNSLRSAFDLRIVLASLNRYHYSSETIVRPLKRIIVHPEYRRGQGLRHDIGILFVSITRVILLYYVVFNWIHFIDIFSFVHLSSSPTMCKL